LSKSNFPTCETCCKLTCYKLQWYCFHQIGSTVALQEHQLDQRTYRLTEKSHKHTKVRMTWRLSLIRDRTLEKKDALNSLLRIFCCFYPSFHLYLKLISPTKVRTFPAFNVTNEYYLRSSVLFWGANWERDFFPFLRLTKKTFDLKFQTGRR